MSTIRFLIVFVSVFALISCERGDEKEQPALIEGLPTIKQLSDSLNAAQAKSVKWAISDSQVIYSQPVSLNWEEELKPFAEANVNYLRFREAFDVMDTVIGKTRTVKFEARSEKQLVQVMEMRLLNGSIDYFHITKKRENFFSSSYQSFTLDGMDYELRVDQEIPFVFSNSELVNGTIIQDGDLWRGELNIGERTLPFQFILNTGDQPRMVVKNGSEYLGFSSTKTDAGSWVFESDFFNSRFVFKLENETSLSGLWINAKRDKTQEIPFHAKRDVGYRFPAKKVPSVDISGQHSAVFYDAEGNPEDSTILILNQTAHSLSGSFLTETGDYRYLDGVVRNDSLFLSSLDGTHAYLFEGRINNGNLEGNFYSGLTWQQNWKSTPDSDASLTDPENMTLLNPETPFSFSFENTHGELVSLEDSAFNNKVLAISLMGTWCSNCMDEALFLKEAYDMYKNRGFEVIAIDFELTSDTAQALANINRHMKSLGADYPVLLADLRTSKQKAAELMPSLSAVYSFPTLILLNRKHEVIKIHTGFSGPASGRKHYEVFRRRYLKLIDSLLTQTPA